MLSDTMSGTYREMGRSRLLLWAIALVYLVSPVDVIPEMFLSVLGLGDDAVVAMWLGGSLLVEADRYIGWRRSRPTVVEGS
ncbi:YkvA family protein [Pseudonocardia endophytica]|nr:YkvA family protein [Pseudonocardia endophytica]